MDQRSSSVVPFNISSRSISVLMKCRGITKNTNNFMLWRKRPIFTAAVDC